LWGRLFHLYQLLGLLTLVTTAAHDGLFANTCDENCCAFATLLTDRSKPRYADRLTKALSWLETKAPGFNHLSTEERDAITDFSLLWGLFESRILNTRGSAQTICNAVEAWHTEGILEGNIFDQELDYFRHRYFDGDFTHHFDGLHLRDADRKPMIRSVLDGSDLDYRHQIAIALIIVLRFRNNLFHGIKMAI
jgi:hypothetical protein